MKRLIACLAWFAFGCGSGEGPPLVIGHVVPAEDAARAEAQKQGLEFAVKDLGDKADPALQNRSLVIRFATASSPEEYESQAVRLTSLGRATALFGGTNMDETERLDHMRVPLFSFASRRSSSLSENAIAMGMDSKDQATAIVAWLRSMAVTEATLVTPVGSRSESAVAAFSEAWKSPWVTPWGEMKTTLKTADDQAKLDAETLVFAGPLSADSPAWKQIGESTKCVIVFASESDAAGMAKLRNANRNVYWTTPFALDPETKMTADFAEKYQRTFGKPPSSDAVLAYDGLRFFLQSMRTTKSAQSERLLKDWETATFPGVTGPLRIEKGRMRRPIYVVHATDGSPAFDYRWQPELLKKEEAKK